MKVTILGSASGISMPGRGHASVALEAGDGLYLFDLGEPVGREVLARGLPVERLRAAFVSHMHSDHAGGLFQFIKNLHLYHNHPEYLPQVERIVVALPEEAIVAVQDFMTASYMFPERLAVAVEYLPATVGRVYSDGNITVTAHGTTHLDGYRELVASRAEYGGLKCQSFAYEVESGGKRVIYSGDVGEISDITGVAAGADLVVLEFGHLLPLEENLQRLKRLGIRSIILTHIFPDYTERGDELQRTADRVLPGVVTVARDGLAVSL